MKIENYSLFTLLKKDLPEIIKKVVVKDAGVGGIKLVYQVTTVKCLVFTLLNKHFIFNLTLFPKNKVKRIFLCPYKELYSSSRDKKLPRNFWGKNDEPLTALWMEMESDYESLESGLVLLKKEIRDTNITKHLTRVREKFYIKLK